MEQKILYLLPVHTHAHTKIIIYRLPRKKKFCRAEVLKSQRCNSVRRIRESTSSIELVHLAIGMWKRGDDEARTVPFIKRKVMANARGERQPINSEQQSIRILF